MSSISSVMNVDDKGSTANIIIVNHVLELSLELADGLEAAPQDICVNRREIVRVPLRKDGTAFPPLDAFPLPPALLEVHSARVDRVQDETIGG
jgi:hypothetical protein